MDMDTSIRIMKYMICAFAVTMFGLGHVFTGTDGFTARLAQDRCNDTGAVGVEITKKNGTTRTYLCK